MERAAAENRGVGRAAPDDHECGFTALAQGCAHVKEADAVEGVRGGRRRRCRRVVPAVGSDRELHSVEDVQQRGTLRTVCCVSTVYYILSLSLFQFTDDY